MPQQRNSIVQPGLDHPHWYGPDDPVSLAIEQMRWFRRRGYSPEMIFAALGKRWIARPFEDPSPSWDDAVWALADVYQRMPVAVSTPEPAGQLALPFRRAA